MILFIIYVMGCYDVMLKFVCFVPFSFQRVGLCDPGFYCVAGANNSSPTDGVTGDVCPAGSFCQEGSSIAQPCSDGESTEVKLCRFKSLSFHVFLNLGNDAKRRTFAFFVWMFPIHQLLNVPSGISGIQSINFLFVKPQAMSSSHDLVMI